MNRRKMCWDVNSYEEEAPVTVYDCHGQVSQLVNSLSEQFQADQIFLTKGWKSILEICS